MGKGLWENLRAQQVVPFHLLEIHTHPFPDPTSKGVRQVRASGFSMLQQGQFGHSHLFQVFSHFSLTRPPKSCQRDILGKRDPALQTSAETLVLTVGLDPLESFMEGWLSAENQAWAAARARTDLIPVKSRRLCSITVLEASPPHPAADPQGFVGLRYTGG